MRKGVVAGIILAGTAGLGYAGNTPGHASDRAETVMTVKVTSADHEIQEGYFTLGDDATVMAKPGSELYKFLAKQRGQRIKITLTEASGPELSRLER